MARETEYITQLDDIDVPHNTSTYQSYTFLIYIKGTFYKNEKKNWTSSPLIFFKYVLYVNRYITELNSV